jgi:hypothetical protein
MSDGPATRAISASLNLRFVECMLDEHCVAD